MIRKANCKINLGLDVLRRREDGYHEIETVIYPVHGLYDVIEVTPAPELVFSARGRYIDCLPEDNLCLRTARLMQTRYRTPPVAIMLDKRVPFAAGLGGGSSNVAAVACAIDELFELHLSEAELIDCVAQLGSDTAFFVRNTPQLCTGRGEAMTPVQLDLGGLWIAIVKPRVSISTREAYAGVMPQVPAIPLSECIARPIVEWQEYLKNDFEPSIFAAYPEVAAAKQTLLDNGALYASMSGSGSAVYGLFSPEQIEKVRDLNLTPFIYQL